MPTTLPCSSLILKLEGVNREGDLSSCQHREGVLHLQFIGHLIFLLLNSGFMIFTKPFSKEGIEGFKTYVVVAEYSSDVAQILHRFCLIALCQPFGGLPVITTRGNAVSNLRIVSLVAIAQTQACRLLSSSVQNRVRGIRHPRGQPTTTPRQIRIFLPKMQVFEPRVALFCLF